MEAKKNEQLKEAIEIMITLIEDAVAGYREAEEYCKEATEQKKEIKYLLSRAEGNIHFGKYIALKQAIYILLEAYNIPKLSNITDAKIENLNSVKGE